MLHPPAALDRKGTTMPGKQDAFVLLGAQACARYPEFLGYLAERELAALVVDDGTGSAPLKVADSLTVDPDRLPDLIEGVRNWADRFRLRGIFNTAEALVTPAAMVADLLGLPNPGLRAAVISRDKYLQRAYFRELSPPFVRLAPKEPIPTLPPFPAVLKPTGRHGGSGIRWLVSAADLLPALDDFAGDEPLILESFVDGIDVSVECLVRRGQVEYENLTEESDGAVDQRFLEMGYTMPALRIPPAVAERIYLVNRRVLTKLGFGTGMLHAEYKVTPAGDVVLMEFAVRNPGDGLLPMYQLSTNRSLEAEIVKVCLDEPVDYPKPVRPVRQTYFDHRPGRLVDVRVDGYATPVVFLPETGTRPRLPSGARSGSALREVLVEWRRGDVLPPLREAADRCGYFLIEADHPDELADLERRVVAGLQVVVR